MAKMGRPVVMTEEKGRQLKAICRLKPRLSDCAAFLEVSEDTIESWIRDVHGITFSEFREQNVVISRFMITRNILFKCEGEKHKPKDREKKGEWKVPPDNTMLIWASKNLCKWSDKNESDITTDGQPIQITYTNNASDKSTP